MTLAAGLLNAYAGYRHGKRQRQQDEYAVEQDELQRSDMLANRQQQAEMQRQTQAREESRYADQQARQQAQDARQGAQDQRSAYEGGYDPTANVEAEAGRVQDVARSGGPGILNAGAAMMQQQAKRPTFDILGQGMVKARESIQERQQRDAREARETDLRTAREYRESDRAEDRTNRVEDRDFQATENAKGRAAGRGGGAMVEQRQFAREQSLQADFKANPIVKKAYATAGNIASLQAALKGDSALDDLSLIYETVKMFDPESVVREGEIALARTANSVPDRVNILISNWNKGKLVSPRMRGMVQELLDRKLEESKRIIEPVQSDFGERSRRWGADSAFVAPDPFRTSGATVSAPPAPPPTGGQVGKYLQGQGRPPIANFRRP